MGECDGAGAAAGVGKVPENLIQWNNYSRTDAL